MFFSPNRTHSKSCLLANLHEICTMRHNEPKKSGTFEYVNWHESQLKIVWAFSFVLPVRRFHRRVVAGSPGASLIPGTRASAFWRTYSNLENRPLIRGAF